MTLYFDASEIALENGETVLDALLRTGHDVAFGCRAGVCQSCLMISDSPVPSAAQQGLSDTQKKLGYFLSCRWSPDSELRVRRSDAAATRVPAKLIEKIIVNGAVAILRFSAEVDYFPGQYATLWKDAKTARSYSIASVPALDNFLEFHIKRIPEGKFSSWAFDDLQVGDALDIQGPMGSCVYSAADLNQPLLLIGLGTGLAPLYGIVRDAIYQGHKGSIRLIVAARLSEQFYLRDDLITLASAVSNFDVCFVAQASNDSDIVESDIYQYMKSEYAQLKGTKVFLCGAESFVRKLKKQCFLQGAAMSDIAADSFLPCGT